MHWEREMGRIREWERICGRSTGDKRLISNPGQHFFFFFPLPSPPRFFPFPFPLPNQLQLRLLPLSLNPLPKLLPLGLFPPIPLWPCHLPLWYHHPPFLSPFPPLNHSYQSPLPLPSFPPLQRPPLPSSSLLLFLPPPPPLLPSY